METMECYIPVLDLKVTDEERIAARYLESRRQRFCIDFGYENVVEKADELFAMECLCLLQTMNGHVN